MNLMGRVGQVGGLVKLDAHAVRHAVEQTTVYGVAKGVGHGAVPGVGARHSGPALGQRGLNIMEFCKAFNAKTQGMEAGLPIPVVITAYADKSFTFIMKTPPATILIKKAAKIQKGSSRPHTDKVGKITRAQAEEIAKTKEPDLTAADLDAAVRTIAGSARSMGIIVEGL